MQLINLTKNRVLSNDLKEVYSLFDQLFGLLRKSNPRSLFFKTRFGIHTFFLKKDIDVLVLDNNIKVKKIKTLKPNSVFFWKITYNYVIELPKNTIKNSDTEIDDQLKLF